MKNHIQNSLQQLNGEATIGHALLWTMENLFPGAPNLRKHKVIFVVSAGENHERKELLKKMALRAKCQGYALFVISLGSPHEDNMEELASYPLDHHLIQLGRIHKPDLDYIVKFLKPFVYSVRRESFFCFSCLTNYLVNSVDNMFLYLQLTQIYELDFRWVGERNRTHDYTLFISWS